MTEEYLRNLELDIADYEAMGPFDRMARGDEFMLRLARMNMRPLIAEVRRLREALTPFALHPDDNAVDGQVRVWVSDVRKAADAYHGK